MLRFDRFVHVSCPTLLATSSQYDPISQYAYYSGLVLWAGGAFADHTAQYCDCCSVPE